MDQHNISLYLYIFFFFFFETHLPPAPLSPIILYSLCVSLRSYPQDFRVCQEELIDVICRHVCSLGFIRSIGSIAIVLLSLPSVRRRVTHTRSELHGHTGSGPAWVSDGSLCVCVCVCVCVCGAKEGVCLILSLKSEQSVCNCI